MEDVTDIVLNLKEVVLKAASAKTYTVRIEKEGPGTVHARDILLVDGLQVLNPDHVIATLDKKGPLVMELTVSVGRGYVPAERNKTPTMPIGTIPIDALFAPVRKVNYTVTNARVGQQTDYDKLTLEVWTNGSLQPQDAVAYAAKILKEQLSIWINFEETEETQYSPSGSEEEPLNENLFRSVDELEFERSQCQLLAEREHSAHWRARPAHRAGHAQDQELRSQEPEGNQRDPGEHGPIAGNEDRQLAAVARALEAATTAKLGTQRAP